MVYDEDSISSKSQLVTLFLLLCFGSLGAHRFYVRKYISGAMYLIAGSTTMMLDMFGIGWALLARVALSILIFYDIYAMYSDSFTDKSGNLVIGKSKYMVYDTFDEREQIIFIEKLNTFMLVLAGLAFYILYFITINYLAK